MGIRFSREVSGGVLSVKGFVEGSSAANCPDIQLGDILMEIDRCFVLGAPLHDIASMLLGKPGSKVDLVFKRPLVEDSRGRDAAPVLVTLEVGSEIFTYMNILYDIYITCIR